MSELWVFVLGVTVFIATSWATLVFGLRRMYDLHKRDMEASERITEVKDLGLTEIYRTRRLDGETFSEA